MAPSVFATVPDKDYLGFFEKTEPKYHDVIKFARFKKEDISRATGINLASIRYDEKIPPELRDRIIEWANLLNLVAGFFKGDPQKTFLWFTISNPSLGNISPRDMIRVGRYKKLMSFVQNALNENNPPAGV